MSAAVSQGRDPSRIPDFTMSPFAIYITVILVAVLSWFLLRRVRRQIQSSRRRQAYSTPFPGAWQAILEQRFPLYKKLPADLKQALHARINYFIQAKEFAGRGGLEITDEVKVLIAGQACVLVLKEEGEIFPGFKTILVYPDTFFSERNHEEGGVVTRARDHRAGESWHRGPVILSWGDVLRGGADDDDGFNVVLHEFAHKLDEQNMMSNGQPLLHDYEHYNEWREVMSREYRAFLERVERRDNEIIDAYGAHSPPEFFAVATESFFEKPVAMRQRLPALYEQLQRFYLLDPASWF